MINIFYKKLKILSYNRSIYVVHYDRQYRMDLMNQMNNMNISLENGTVIINCENKIGYAYGDDNINENMIVDFFNNNINNEITGIIINEPVLSASSMDLLSKIICDRKLETLTMEYPLITNCAFNKLGDLIASNVTLTKLVLSKIRTDVDAITLKHNRKGFTYLLESFRKNKTIDTIVLESWMLWKSGYHEIFFDNIQNSVVNLSLGCSFSTAYSEIRSSKKPIVTFLEKNKSVQKLSFKNVCFDKYYLMQIFNALHRNETLKSLEISCLELHSQFKEFTDMLLTNNTLERISIHDSILSSDSCKILLDAFNSNKIVSNLAFKKCEISACLNDFCDLLSKISHVRYLKIETRELNDENILKLADIVAKNESIHTLSLSTSKKHIEIEIENYLQDLIAKSLINNYSITSLSIGRAQNLCPQLQMIIDRNINYRFKRQKAVAY